MQLKYISDLHLYDVASLWWRPNFSTLDSYADNLLYTWNSTVEDEQLVIIVGDLGTVCPKSISVLEQLKGKKVLVIGNHDTPWLSVLHNNPMFQGLYQEISGNGIVVRHIPDDQMHDTYFIHGHHHRYDMPGMHQALQQYIRDTRRLNCSADQLRNKPMTIGELITNKEELIHGYQERGII